MPMTRDEYEELLGKLNNAELPHSERTELLQTLRADYSGVLDDHQKFETNLEKLQKDNDDLVLSNSKLFRMTAIDKKDDDNPEDDKDFSENVTLESLLEGK